MQPDAYADYVRRVVDQAPPLSEATRSRLATILRPAIEAQTSTVVTAAQAPALELEAA